MSLHWSLHWLCIGSHSSYIFFHLHTVLPGRATCPMLKMKKSKLRSRLGLCMVIACLPCVLKAPVPQGLPISNPGLRLYQTVSLYSSTDCLFTSSNPAPQQMGSCMTDRTTGALEQGKRKNTLTLYVGKTSVPEGHRY